MPGGPIGRGRSALRDIRALGVGTPLRAAYEASKRFGGHAAVFGRLARSSRSPGEIRSPFEVFGVPEVARRRTLDAAERILGGTVEVFGQELAVGPSPNWHALIHAPGEWPVVPWWQIDLRSGDRPGDVKWAWELARHRHLVLVARAAYLAPGDPRYAGLLNNQLESWIEANPPEVGVHWYSNLEISLRAIAWLQVIALATDQISPAVLSAIADHLYHSGRHLIADLPYTVSTMRNNHLLGDPLGLIALGSAFDGKAAARWRALGDRIFEKQLARHMRPDGSMAEDSLSYHRFVLEMLSMRVLLGGASDTARRALRAAAQFLARLGALEGPVPQYGDWDEGRVFAVAEDPVDVTGSVRLALALSGSGAPAGWREQHDEVAWFAREGNPLQPEAAETAGKDVGAGIARANRESFTVWLKAGSGPSHGHADLTSVTIAYGGQTLTGDPGTGTYNGDMGTRNYFRSSLAHNVSRIQGIDQLEPHRAFRWVHRANGKIGDPVVLGDAIVLWGTHDAYTRLPDGGRVARVVVVSSGGVHVADHFEQQPDWVGLDIPFSPAVEIDLDADRIVSATHVLTLTRPGGEVSSLRGSHEPFAGWWSTTYGEYAPTTVLRYNSANPTSVRWGVSVATNAAPDAAAAVIFEPGHVRLRVEAGGVTHLRVIHL